MTSARERAVEAGARAFNPAVFEGERGDWFGTAYARQAAICVLRAAFPILAEELVAWHDERATYYREEYERLQGESEHMRAHYCEETVKRHEMHAAALRARIQQMAEAL